MILVVGGAGYIGSHLVEELVRTHEVVVLDNLSTGHRGAVDAQAVFVEGDLGSESDLESVFSKYPINAVMHFAANSLVGESVTDPLKYYENNVAATLTLLKVMLKYNVKNFIFSSTAATYGIPDVNIIREDSRTQPINPYGQSKLMVENILADFATAYDLHYVVLRYFNAAGASESGRIGEQHDPETHLIPIILQHLLGQREQISVFGDDYD
ncbi:UDP-glucose 4-epimerase GalE, partial [Mesobacillus selenatarsenatis]|uniref:UDP-glucose 4-epimerase GalE n=1 Tax=Mesobacillus selenatarsenatis TaxID=388741 RepID=UPI003D7C230B